MRAGDSVPHFDYITFGTRTISARVKLPFPIFLAWTSCSRGNSMNWHAVDLFLGLQHEQNMGGDSQT